MLERRQQYVRSVSNEDNTDALIGTASNDERCRRWFGCNVSAHTSKSSSRCGGPDALHGRHPVLAGRGAPPRRAARCTHRPLTRPFVSSAGRRRRPCYHAREVAHMLAGAGATAAVGRRKSDSSWHKRHKQKTAEAAAEKVCFPTGRAGVKEILITLGRVHHQLSDRLVAEDVPGLLRIYLRTPRLVSEGTQFGTADGANMRGGCAG